MSLRSAVLKAALPHVAETGFTRSALVDAMRALPSSSPSSSSSGPSSSPASSAPKSELSATAAENALDVMFGAGLSPARALVEAWCAAGLDAMPVASGPGASRPADEVLFDPLSRRLWHSAAAGASLLDAHALLATNTAVSSLPVPPGAHALIRALGAVLPLPGGAGGPYGATSEANTLTALNLGRIPAPPNPAAGLAYAWAIADRAVNLARPNAGKGVMREDRGFGVEWYSTRVGVMMAYIEAESQLLAPLPGPLPTDAPARTADANPLLAPALATLRASLRKMQERVGAARAVENAADAGISLLEEMGRSVAGIIRSRGF